MALLPCRECGQQVSSEAAACPHCGAPAPTAAPLRAAAALRPRRKVHPGVWALGGFFTLLIAGTCSLAVTAARRTAAIAAEEAAEPKLVDFAEISVDSSEISDSVPETDGSREGR